MIDDFDAQVRTTAFSTLDELVRAHGDALSLDLLSAGFEVRGRRIPFLNMRKGIFKPSVLNSALSITTAPIKHGKPRPYEDELRADGLIGYKYRGSDPLHPDNSSLRAAMRGRAPLIYFYGLIPGRYVPQYPVYIVGDDPPALCFTVAVDDARMLLDPTGSGVQESIDAARRQYVTRTTQQRLHQRAFRERVLEAYHSCCAICLLRHANLLEAAHILPDGHPLGEPWVYNGISLCKLHHAAYDADILGIRPDRVIQIREDILKETDGPMLTHGLQKLDGVKLQHVPHTRSLQPKPEFLEVRYQQFRAAG